MDVQPYLFFKGDCEEAIAFYREALGAEVTMLFHYKDSPDPAMIPPESGDKVMHARLRIGNSVVLAADGCNQRDTTFAGFSLSLTVSKTSEAERLFAALAEGGTEQMPLAETFFSPRFGMVADRFGVSWMVYVTPEGEEPQ